MHELASAGRNSSVGYTCTVCVHVAQLALVSHACALGVVSEHDMQAALFASRCSANEGVGFLCYGAPSDLLLRSLSHQFSPTLISCIDLDSRQHSNSAVTVWADKTTAHCYHPTGPVQLQRLLLEIAHL